MSKPKLLLLVDSGSYIRTNCYQHQLLETLEARFSVTMLPLRELRWNPFIRVGKFDLILSVLKQRTLARHLDSVARVLNGRPLAIYDQDPWQAYIDDSPTRGCYKDFVAKLNLQALLLTSDWWAKFCRDRGLPARFVRMGMLPRYCDPGPQWDHRSIELGFQGTLHSHRKTFFSQLRDMGLDVSVLPSGSYADYLDTLHRIRIYIHTEDAPWLVEGKSIPRNSLWIKDVEVAARGCFAIRNWDEDASAYDISDLPTISAFRQFPDVAQFIDRVRSMAPKARRDMVEETVSAIARRNDWRTVVDCLEQAA